MENNSKILSLIIVFFAVLFISCEKDIDVDLPESTDKIVVDGWIEQGKSPHLYITRNSPYFSNLDSVSIRELVVSVAKVTVSDGVNSEVLTLKRDESAFPPFYYQGSSLIGKAGTTYYLTIELSGKKYTAQTTIPEPVYLDSIWFEKDIESDNLGFVKINFDDPGETLNYYRVFTKRIGKDKNYVPVYFSSFKDGTFNGEKMKLKLIRGMESFSDISDDTYFSIGDTVMIKFCSIDKPSFDFWVNTEKEIYTSANPFASSYEEVPTNINGGIGIWCGYGANYYSYIIR